MQLSDFDYHLPESLIAQQPSDRRDGSRLMVVDRASGYVSHHVFAEFQSFVRQDDCLVVNETKVFPARLAGQRAGTGGRVELLLVHPEPDGAWTAMARPGRRLRAGAEIAFDDDPVTATVEAVLDDGMRRVRFNGDLQALIARRGRIPLPPYIDREASDADVERYQTVYAKTPGAVAAPTAGLHFTPEILARVGDRGVDRATVLLHVGPGTFKPVEVENVAGHRMHAEYFEVDDVAAAAVARAKQAGGRVVSVGTTSVRVLESQADGVGGLRVGKGWTDIFIYPGYTFTVVDALLTNFHLPRSTLLMLVSAFAGREVVMSAYEEAVREGYRFYSYGDAMLVV